MATLVDTSAHTPVVDRTGHVGQDRHGLGGVAPPWRPAGRRPAEGLAVVVPTKRPSLEVPVETTPAELRQADGQAEVVATPHMVAPPAAATVPLARPRQGLVAMALQMVVVVRLRRHPAGPRDDPL